MEEYVKGLLKTNLNLFDYDRDTAIVLSDKKVGNATVNQIKYAKKLNHLIEFRGFNNDDDIATNVSKMQMIKIIELATDCVKVIVINSKTLK